MQKLTKVRGQSLEKLCDTQIEAKIVYEYEATK